MNEALLKILERLEKVSITLLATLCVTLGFLIFVSDPIADRLKVLAFRNDYAVFLGPTFLLLSALLLARIIGEVTNLFKVRRVAHNRNKQLNFLTPEEKGYLCEFVIKGRNTINVGIDDGIMGGLVAKQICYLSSKVFDMLEGASYNLQPWARSYLDRNPRLLDGAEGEPLTPRQKLRRRDI